jgi:hypothetical protein
VSSEYKSNVSIICDFETKCTDEKISVALRYGSQVDIKGNILFCINVV